MTRALAPGEHGEIGVWLVRKDEHGKWKRVTGSRRAGDKYRARAYYRAWDGANADVSRMADRRGDAESAVVDALRDRLPTTGRSR